MMSHEVPPSVLSGPFYNAPMALDDSLTRTRGLEPRRAKKWNRQRVQSSRRDIIGPMPLRVFMGQFLFLPDSPDPKSLLSSRKAFDTLPLDATSSVEMIEPLVSSLNKRTKHKSRCPGFVFMDTCTRMTQPRKLGFMKPHICCFTAANAEVVQSTDASSRCELGYAELFIEVKPHISHDFFVDPSQDATNEDRASHDFLAQSTDQVFTKHRDRAFGQHVSYVTEILARQHRTFYFSISLSGPSARLFRWDRAGCAVTESFNIRDRPEVLCDFLWRFSHLSDAGRGHDPTVHIASPEDEIVFRDSISRHVQYQLAVQDSKLAEAVAEHYLPGSVAVVHVLENRRASDASNMHRFIISRPVVSPLSWTGRGTRGYWAVDAQSGQTVFLKDTWRNVEPTKLEGDVLRRLSEQDVRHIPAVICHGDVPDYVSWDGRIFPPNEYQVTMTDEFCRDKWVCLVAGRKNWVAKLWHYRIVEGTVGYGLKRFLGTEELLYTTYDVFHAMRDALSKASRLHRDISIGNIIIVREPDHPIRRGYLVDWESSCEVDGSGQAVEPGRAGTWYFMSMEMLRRQGRNRQQTLQDDMESLLYVILYCSFLWLPHNLDKKQLVYTIKTLFEFSEWWDGAQCGGNGKVVNALHRVHTSPVKWNPVIKKFLDTMMEYHSTLKPEENDDRWSNPDDVDSFWGAFLRENHPLPRDDRFVHPHSHATGIYESFHGSFDLVVYSTEAISLHRPPSFDGDNLEPPTKKSRPDPTSHEDAASSALIQPRRSLRIAQQKKPEATTATSTKIPANGSTTRGRRARHVRHSRVPTSRK